MTSPASSKLNGTKLLIDLPLVHSDNYPKSKPQETRLTSDFLRVTEEPKMNKLFEPKVQGLERWLNS